MRDLGDERPVPRAQPRHHRRGQPGRDRGADPGRLQGRGPAADRRRRHLLRRLQRGRRAQGQRRGPDRRRPGRQGRDASSSTATTCKVDLPGQQRRRVRHGDRRRIKVKTLLGAMYLALEPAGSGQLQEGARSRVEPHQLAVRRRAGVLRPRRALRADRHRPAGQVAQHAGRPDQQHPGGVPGRPRRAVARSRRTSPRATTSSTRCSSNLKKVSEVLADRDQDIVDADAATATCCSGRSSPAARPCTTCWSSTSKLSTQLTAPGPADPRRPQAGADHLDSRGRRAQQEPGQPRQQPAADGAVLPGLRQHARQRSVVRHLHPEPAARSRQVGGEHELPCSRFGSPR